jgi:hypothetical protein
MHKVTIALILVVVLLLLLELTDFIFFEFFGVDTSPQSHRYDFSN